MIFVIPWVLWRTLVDSMVRGNSTIYITGMSDMRLVAVTRTKALLIVIGDHQVLSLDPLWRSFLNYVYNNGGWRGPHPDWDTTVEVDIRGGYDTVVRERAQANMNEFASRMEALVREEMDDNGAGVDRPWRDVE